MSEQQDKLNPVSYRIDDETKEKIKKISEELGLGQQGTLQKLVETFQIQKSKTGITDTTAQTLFAKFENLTSQMNQSYLSIIQSLQTANENARMTVLNDLESKDFTIQENIEKIKDLRDQLTVANQLKIEATDKAKKYIDENLELNIKLDSLLKELEQSKSDFSSKLLDKDNLNKLLTDSCNDLKVKVESMAAEHQELKEKSKELDKVIVERDSLIKENAESDEKLKVAIQRVADAVEEHKKRESELLESTKQKAELSQQKAILDLERKYQDQIQQIKEEKQKEIDKYQTKYFELLERMNTEKEEKGSELQ